MKAYWAVLSARFRLLLQYRAAAIAGFGTQLFWGLIRMMIFAAFFHGTTSPQPMTLEQTIAYVWLGQAFLGLLPFRSDTELNNMVRTGNVCYELLRPVNIYNLWFARTIANRIAPTLLKSTPMLIVAVLAGWIRWPGLGNLAAGLVALTAAVVLTTALTMLMNITVFWTLAGQGVSTAIAGLLFILSGMIVPLPLMPDWLQPLLNVLPFRGLIDIPFRLFTALLPPDALWGLLTHQLAWCLVMIFFGRWLMARAMRRVVVQGG